MCMVKLPSKLQQLVGSMKMRFGDSTSKNYALHIGVVTFLCGNLKITDRGGGGCPKVMPPIFLSSYILVVWKNPLYQ
jgi:hypothetical protein